MEFSPKPRTVPHVNTKYRRIQTPIPAPETISILEQLAKYEPQATASQPPIVWDRASGFQIYDGYGNMWLDFSSGVLVANTGYMQESMHQAILEQVNKGLWHTFLFPNKPRAQLVQKLVEVAPAELDTVFLLTTGSESTENALKQMRCHGLGLGGPQKIGVITFSGAFHGRTLGAQQMGGIPQLKDWIVSLDPHIHVVPFPDCMACPWGKESYDSCDQECFDNFLNQISGYLGNDNFAENLAGIISESYQGGEARFLPKGFVQLLSTWCRENQILLTFDEVQAGFGRTGKFFAFEHYGVVPDLICCGKGISGSLPLSAIIGSRKILTQFPPGALTNTHSGNPISCAAALANLQIIEEQGLVRRAAQLEEVLWKGIASIREAFPQVVGNCRATGLVGAINVVQKSNGEPNPRLALDITERALEKGLMLFAPVGPGPATIKINPPLVITQEALEEGLSTLYEAFQEEVSK